jgi:hypothetical protein
MTIALNPHMDRHLSLEELPRKSPSSARIHRALATRRFSGSIGQTLTLPQLQPPVRFSISNSCYRIAVVGNVAGILVPGFRRIAGKPWLADMDTFPSAP